MQAKQTLQTLFLATQYHETNHRQHPAFVCPVAFTFYPECMHVHDSMRGDAQVVTLPTNSQHMFKKLT